jgi:ketosteroid isomerase-like protein
MKYLLLLTTIVYSQILTGQTKVETEIRSILNQQTIAWNQGDLDAFMKGYWESDSLMFIGKSGVTYGFQQTLANYKKNYPTTAAMGELNFHILQVKKLTANVYFVLGKWQLTRKEMGNIGGHYTLLFRKIKGKWVIVSDHSS